MENLFKTDALIENNKTISSNENVQGIKTMYNIFKENSKRMYDQRGGASNAYEHHTMSIKLPRMSGHTSALVEIISENPEEKWLVISVNRQISSIVREMLMRTAAFNRKNSDEIIFKNSLNSVIFHSINTKFDRLRGIEFTTIAAEGLSYIDEEHILYNLPMPRGKYLFLGR